MDPNSRRMDDARSMVRSPAFRRKGLASELLPPEGGTTSLFGLRRDVSYRRKLNQRCELLERQSPDNQFRRLRVEERFEAELLQLPDGLSRFVREPDLNLGLAVTREFQFFRARLRVLVIQSFNHRGDRRMQLCAQLLVKPLFCQRRHRGGFDRRSALARDGVEGHDALSLHRLAGQFRGLEAPLLRRLEGGVAEQWMAVDDTCVDHLAAFTDRDFDLNGALCSCGFGYRRVSGLYFPGRAALQDAAWNFEIHARYLWWNTFGWRRRWWRWRWRWRWQRCS